ncbi:MAG: SUMF1/EgtB/PvdO family nonheme iron enzyme [Verrucomicrobia bacterium]|nr:SUMF1/EgtB/PvdO family nonheme iron enzyme [Verrucomicrobiota bacterium]
MRTLIGQKIGDYEIFSELGRGAMGVVYKARQYSLDRPVALKVLAADLARDESYIERFKREAILAATVIHPNIVTVYEADTHMDLDSGERVQYFVMEHIEGETVQRRLARQDRIPADEVAAIGVRIAQGLDCAWRKARIIHRDIKPSNIFLTSSGDVKVGDLGLARVAGDAQSSLTATGAIIGTAYYMSPEQVRGESDLDFRSDIYSLGCTLYRMLCGRHLYEGAFASVIVKHLTEPPPSIRMIMPDCPVAIVKVIEKMLAKHPSGRQQSYQELIEDLRRAHEEITGVSPEKAAARKAAEASKTAPVARKRPSLVVAGIAAVALAGVMWWAPWQPAEQNVGGASAPRQSATEPSRGTEAAPTFQKPAPPPIAVAPVAETPAKPAPEAAAVMQPTPPPAVAPPEPEADPFIKEVAGLPPEQQVARVITRLKELNPDFDSRETHKIEDGAVTELAISTVGVTDISPLAAFKGLKRLSLAPSGQTRSPLTDLTPLKGLPLTALWCHNTSVRFLYPLENMPLTTLTCGNTLVDNLTSLRGMPLTVFSCDNTPVAFLSPLEGMPLNTLWCNNTKVTDLSPLQAMPLQELKCDFVPTRDAAILRGIQTLARINDLPAAAFWKRTGGAMPPPSQPLPSPDGFQPLFNGRDLTGWAPMLTTGQKNDVHQPATGGWTVQSGELVCSTTQSGWLKSEQQYGDFVLQLEFKLPRDGNSGVYIRCPDSGPLSNAGMEIQIIDEHGVSAPGFRSRPGRLTGAIFGVVGSQQPPRRPAGEWNSMEIRCEGDNVEVTLNGTRTVSANMNQYPELRNRPRSGYVGISNVLGEAKGTAFRNIRIKNLPPEPTFDWNMARSNAAVIEATDMRWISLTESDRKAVPDGVKLSTFKQVVDWWRRVPQKLKEYNAQILIENRWNGGDPRRGVVNFSVKKAGWALLACYFGWAGGPGDWESERWKEEDFRNHGWRVLKPAHMGGTLISGTDREQVVFTKWLAAGETGRYRCSKYGPPNFIILQRPPVALPSKPIGPQAVLPKLSVAPTSQPFMTSIGMELVPIPPGEFMLGSTPEERDWERRPVDERLKEMFFQSEAEQPRKAVIRQTFWLGRTEVTVGQWKQFVNATSYVTDAEKTGSSWAPMERHKWRRYMGGADWKNPHFEGEQQVNHPVSCISWNDAVVFCGWLNGQEKNKGKLPAGCRIRMPTEAEWEYACRAGTQTRFWWGDSPEDGEGRLHWLYRGPRDRPESVVPVDHYGERGRNKFGLADMLGNVWEWCLDGFDSVGAHDEFWVGDGLSHVARGGGFGGNPGTPRCSLRQRQTPSYSSAVCGFRVACGPEK